jgi:hypothetical protein
MEKAWRLWDPTVRDSILGRCFVNSGGFFNTDISNSNKKGWPLARETPARSNLGQSLEGIDQRRVRTRVIEKSHSKMLVC